MKNVNFVCKSVLGGWQSGIEGTNIVFGPVYNNILELYDWQKTWLTVLNGMGFQTLVKE